MIRWFAELMVGRRLCNSRFLVRSFKECSEDGSVEQEQGGIKSMECSMTLALNEAIAPSRCNSLIRNKRPSPLLARSLDS